MNQSGPPLPEDLKHLLDTERSTGEMPNSARDRLRDRLGLPDPSSFPEPEFSSREAPTLRRPRVGRLRTSSQLLMMMLATFVVGAVLGGFVMAMFQSRVMARSSEFGVERAMLDTARRALARDDVNAVLTSVSMHEREFPNGQLSEEREALRVQALFSAGRREQAENALKRFEDNYPDSLFLRGVRNP